MKLSIITFIVISLVTLTSIGSDAFAGGGWSEKSPQFDVLFDQFYNVESIVYDGETYNIAAKYDDEDLARISPAAGSLEDADYGSVNPISILLDVYKDFALD